jgi:hypothetical protein
VQINIPLKDLKILLSKDLSCAACSLEKLIIRSSKNKITNESPSFLDKIQGDIYRPISPSYGSFRYFIILIDASTRLSISYNKCCIC